MKLNNNTNQTSVDHGKKKEDEFVYDKIVAEYGEQIQLMLNCPKNEESTHFSFRGMQKCGTMAAQIAAKSDRVKTVSEVYRASLNLGVSILFRLLFKNPPENMSCFFEQAAEAEFFAYQAQLLDKSSYLISKYYEGYMGGVIDFEEFKSKSNKLVKQLPKGLQDMAQDRAEQILKGTPLSRISAMRSRGRPLKEEGN